MKKLLLVISFLLIAKIGYCYTAISPEAYISSDDVTIARMQGNQNIIVNAINNADGGNIKAGTITSSQMDANTNPENRWDEAFNDFVYTGLIPPTSSSLTTVTTSGTAFIRGVRVVKDATSKTYDASQWTYVDLSKTGTYTYSPTAIGGAVQAIATNSIRLCRVSSDATTIAAVRDDRVMGISLSNEDYYRRGLQISVTSPDALVISPGIAYHGSTRLLKTANTALNIGTSADWISGARTTSTTGYVVISNLGVVGLTTTAPTKADISGDTVGDLRYSVIGGAYYRCLSQFYMDANGSGNVQNYGAVKDWQDGTTLGVTGTFTAGTSCVMNPYAVSSTVMSAHGLGTTPTLVVAYLECLATDLGYAAGDRVYLQTTVAASSGYIVEWDASNVRILAHGTLPDLINRSTYSLDALDTSKWKVVVTPYKLN